MKNLCGRQENLLRLNTFYGEVNSPVEWRTCIFRLDFKKEMGKLKVQGLKCNKFVLVFRLMLIETKL